jgi:hypothetical protein
MDLIRVGAGEEEVGKQVETEGVDNFAACYQKVLDTIEARRAEAGGMKDPDGNCDKVG